MCDVIIIGAGGHAKVIADIVIKRGDNLLGFLDDFKTDKIFGDYDVLGKIENISEFENKAKFIIAIGNNETRKQLAQKYLLDWYTAIHPSAQIGINCEIGEGTCIMANAVINSDSKVGEHCIVNTAAVIDHENKISDFVHISPRATLCGNVFVGECTHVGAGVVVKNNVSICDNVTVGISAAVIRDITDSGKYIGVPAKKIG